MANETLKIMSILIPYNWQDNNISGDLNITSIQDYKIEILAVFFLFSTHTTLHFMLYFCHEAIDHKWDNK